MSINDEAIDSLTTAMNSLLPDVGDPVLQPILIIQPDRIIPTGISGFIGFNRDPVGDILGRRIEATVELLVKASNILALGNKVNKITHAFLGTERKTLLELGILIITLDEMGPVSKDKDDSHKIVEQDLKFKVLYEFLKRPEEPDDLIREIPINLNVS
ncbi:hypothetical protein U27_05583 [Candidatus Vecturithrix granuli]|uniref:Uncharacterized protein n=1 Tax=Vecturithrix granuli TaxID=1499967 RepID=A0A081C204_VECG1|nr:hypothetical protein U27_05583 [Candidatus Vecturithrix granuli]